MVDQRWSDENEVMFDNVCNIVRVVRRMPNKDNGTDQLRRGAHTNNGFFPISKISLCLNQLYVF